MSHELRTPLNAVIGFSEILSNELMGPIGQAAYLEYANDIQDSGTHLLSLINDILDLSKVEAGKFDLQEELLDISKTVDAAVRIVRERVDNAQLSLRVNVEPDLPPLFADARALKQILLNLLSNSAKFTPAGGVITVDAERDSTGLFVHRRLGHRHRHRRERHGAGDVAVRTGRELTHPSACRYGPRAVPRHILDRDA